MAKTQKMYLGDVLIGKKYLGNDLILERGAFASPWVLDNFPATAAYSVRKLASEATASFRVKRISDNTEQDIGFDSSGNLDTGSLFTFVGAGTARITDWYDQSGNGNHTTLAYGNGAELVTAGSLITSNGKPAPYFLSDGTQPDAYDTANFISSPSAKTVYVVYEPTAVGGNDNVFNLANTTTTNNAWKYVAPGEIDNNNIYYNTTAASAGNQYLANVVQSGSAMPSDFDLYVNGTFESATSSNSGTIGNIGGRFVMGGSNTTAGGFYYGKIQEIIVFNSQFSASDRLAVENEINGYYSIYV
jgi:hypothetical protein